jgi:hypothetical protein
MKHEEVHAFTFTPVLFGVGPMNFKEEGEEMGIENVANVGSDIKAMIAWLSASVSSSASGATPDFTF